MTQPLLPTGVSFGGSGCQWALHKRLPISSLWLRVSLRGGPDDCPLPVVIYLDDIAMYGDTQEEVLEDILEAVKLACCGQLYA